MVRPILDKAKCFSLVNHSIKQFIVNTVVNSEYKDRDEYFHFFRYGSRPMVKLFILH